MNWLEFEGHWLNIKVTSWLDAKNICEPISPERLEGFRPNLTQIFYAMVR